MQKTFFIVLCFVMISCKQESKQKFEVSGKIQNSSAKKIYLEEATLGSSQSNIVDSSNISSDGSFHLRSTPREESLCALYLKDGDKVLGQFINDVPSININADASKNSFVVSGSTATSSLEKFVDAADAKRMELFQLQNQMTQLQKSNPKDSMLLLINNQGSQKMSQLKTSVENFLQNSQSPVASFIVIDRYAGLFSEDEMNGLMNKVALKFPTHKGVQSEKQMYENRMAAIKQRQQAQQTSWVGKDAPEISLPDANGKTVTLSSFKGKFVLVDFWASWCNPCRGENPNVVKAYNQFKNKNFTILGVSLDSDKNKWQKAIQQDGLTWTHVSDLKEWESAVVPVYGFAETGIPFNVLVDPSGKIIAQGLRGDALEQKLSEVLK